MHIEKTLTEKVLISLGNALKKSGVLYASYKYGTNTKILEGRYYNNFDESSFGLVIGNIKNLNIINQSSASKKVGYKNFIYNFIFIRFYQLIYI